MIDYRFWNKLAGGQASLALGPWSGRSLAKLVIGGLAAALLSCSAPPDEQRFEQHAEALVVVVPARVEAENYERFSDSDTQHQGDCGSGPVDAETTADPSGGGCNVGWTAPGEWLEFDLSAAQAGSFELVLRVASAEANRSLHVEIDGNDVSGPILSPASGWQSWEDRVVSGVALAEGSHTLRVVFDTGSVNLNYINFQAVQTAGNVILAASFDADAEGFTYQDDAFRFTNAPAYASGSVSGGQLEISLGGQDDTVQNGMSGGFTTLFALSSAASVTIAFDYTLDQSCSYETDESSELLLSVNSSLLGSAGSDAVATVSGNGNNCPGSSAAGTFSTTIPLNVGLHTVVLGGYNNKKTYSDEVTTIRIDNVLITSNAGGTDTCNDAEVNGDETALNCGGSVCPPCNDGQSCLITSDCQSGSCQDNVCQALPALCANGVVDGNETDVDCGGPFCRPCSENERCFLPRDCEDGACWKNHHCVSEPTCADSSQNGEETSTDCGGSVCPGCPSGGGCQQNSDCEDNLCVNDSCQVAPSCTNGQQDGTESDLNCGGDCTPCIDGQFCNANSDCRSDHCVAGVCELAPSCADSVTNGAESDLNCGGGVCPTCLNGEQCNQDTDCASYNCEAGRCAAPPSCADAVQNGDETDVDCGGSCAPCDTGQRCTVNADCLRGSCSSGACGSGSGTGSVLIDAHFDAGDDGFHYQDDTFRSTNTGSYAAGVVEGGQLAITLGGLDNTAQLGISGAFVRSFNLPEPAEVTISASYSIEQSCTYETDESSEVLLAVNGSLLGVGGSDAIDTISGNGNNCPGSSSSGEFTTTLSLTAGVHNVALGGYNNKKTYNDEITQITIDDVRVTTSAEACAPDLTDEQWLLCEACGGTVSCDDSCSVTVPQNVGAPCGSCGGTIQCDGSCSIGTLSGGQCERPVSDVDRMQACSVDPRVLTGLVSLEVCTGASIFFTETFDGNGRTCGSCHPAENNYTIDPEFVATLHSAEPTNPLFVNEFVPALANLETPALLANALILENLDGFQDPTNRFVSRSVPHLFSLATSIDPDPADNVPSPPVHRLGWSGDGAPGDGGIDDFLIGAITQHFTQRLERVPGVDFRQPTALEVAAVAEFQLSLGRLNELELAQVRLADPSAEQGRAAFLDPARARCGTCHSNAGANFSQSGLNRNFDNGVRGTLDGGFGGADLTEPNVAVFGVTPDAFGDLTFSVPPLIEAADTPPFFHSNFTFAREASLEDVVQFYGDGAFQHSAGAVQLEQIFGPATMTRSDLNNAARMLRVLNAAFNLDIATQRLDAAYQLAVGLGETRADVQIGLMRLAIEEIADAEMVLAAVLDLYPAAQLELQAAQGQLASGINQATWTGRQQAISAAAGSLAVARTSFGSAIQFVMGQGNLMY